MRSSLLSAVLGLICFIAAQHFVCVCERMSVFPTIEYSTGTGMSCACFFFSFDVLFTQQKQWHKN